MSNSSSSSGGAGFFSLLALVFISAKVFGFEPVASWSWWAVTAPLWGPLVVFVPIAVVVGLVVWAWHRWT